MAATKEEPDYYNRIVGVDGNFMFSDNDLVDFQVASGSTEKEYDRNRAYNLSYTRTGDLWGAKFNFDRVEPAFEINRIGYIQKEPDRGWNKGLVLVRTSPRINKYHVRRIIANLEYEYNRNLFTTRYIDTWLERYPEFIPDKKFGTTIQSESEKRTISGGIREANNFRLVRM